MQAPFPLQAQARLSAYVLPYPRLCDGSFWVQNEFDMVYKDDLSISLSTAYLFNYPTIGFARLPVSLTISLSVFSCRVSFSDVLLARGPYPS